MRPFPGFEGPLWLRQKARLAEEAQRARKAAEAAAGELERILESITDGFCSLDRDYRYKYVNRQAEEILKVRWGQSCEIVFRGEGWVNQSRQIVKGWKAGTRSPRCRRVTC